jgi:transposase
MILQGSSNTKLFMSWIEQVVVMDNASFHKSPKIRETIKQAGCRLIYLPPYSPDLNPIEIFWANMKQWIKYNIPHITNTWNPILTFFNNKYST